METDATVGQITNNESNFQNLEGQVGASFRCDTSQSTCSGLAYFRNTAGGTYSYTVWFQNSNTNRSNFVLEPGREHSIHVQGGDTFSYASGNGLVPIENQRYWIGVA